MSKKVNKNPNLKSETIFNENKERKIYGNRNKIKKVESPNKALNAVQFIKQKNKFFIEDTFNYMGTMEFLASKEVAMRVIKLDDEIEESNVKKKNFLQLDDVFSPNNKRYKSSKSAGKNTISPKKSRKKLKSMNCEENYIGKKENRKHKSKPQKMKEKISNISSYMKSNFDSKKRINNIIEEKEKNNISGEDNIIIIGNSNEPSENNFQHKLKEYESIKNINKIIKENNYIRKSQSKIDFNYMRRTRKTNSVIKSNKENQSQFLFSEIYKSKMEEDDINISSIDESDRACISISPKKKNKIKVKRCPVKISNKKIKKRLNNQIDSIKDNENHKENNRNEEDRMEIREEKDSLISILSDLI